MKIKRVCWIKNKENELVFNKLLYRIRSKDPAHKLLHRIKDSQVDWQISHDDIPCFLRKIVTVAIASHHGELINHMLGDNDFCRFNEFKFDLPIHCRILLRPINCAINYGNSALVKAFLRAGSSVLDHCEGAWRWENSITPIELTFHRDQLEILKLLVAHDVEKNKGVTLRDVTPLHIAMSIALKEYHDFNIDSLENDASKQWRLTMTTFVKVVIESGDPCGVHFLDRSGLTPLEFFYNSILEHGGVFPYTNGGQRLIVDLTEMLLAAGSDPNNRIRPLSFDGSDPDPGDVIKDPEYALLCQLLDLDITNNLGDDFFYYISRRLNGAKLGAELVAVFLRYKQEPGKYFSVVLKASRSVYILARALNGDALKTKLLSARTLAKLNVVMDILGDIFRGQLLAGVRCDDFYYSRRTDTYDIHYDGHDNYYFSIEYANYFMHLASFALEAGQPRKLLYMMLSSLNTTAVIRLKRTLALMWRPNVRVAIDDAEMEFEQNYNLSKMACIGLERIGEVEVPRSLKARAREVINRELLLNNNRESVSTLGLPKQLELFLLYEDVC